MGDYRVCVDVHYVSRPLALSVWLTGSPEENRAFLELEPPMPVGTELIVQKSSRSEEWPTALAQSLKLRVTRVIELAGAIGSTGVASICGMGVAVVGEAQARKSDSDQLGGPIQARPSPARLVIRPSMPLGGGGALFASTGSIAPALPEVPTASAVPAAPTASAAPAAPEVVAASAAPQPPEEATAVPSPVVPDMVETRRITPQALAEAAVPTDREASPGRRGKGKKRKNTLFGR